jgi:hypothetical protein
MTNPDAVLGVADLWSTAREAWDAAAFEFETAGAAERLTVAARSRRDRARGAHVAAADLRAPDPARTPGAAGATLAEWVDICGQR